MLAKHSTPRALQTANQSMKRSIMPSKRFPLIVRAINPVMKRATQPINQPSGSLHQSTRSFSLVASQNIPDNADPKPLAATHADDEEVEFGYASTDNVFEENRLDNSQMADPSNRTFVYLMQGTAAAVYASFGRVAVMQFVSFLSASADVLAVSTIDVDIHNIPEGSASTIKWRGKPIFIRHRTQKEIDAADADDNVDLRHPETDASRFHDKREWAVLVGICTHLGCVPINAAGDYGGWFCPCHGSHYDTSGRIRKGPAPENLEVPPYKFLSDTKIRLG